MASMAGPELGRARLQPCRTSRKMDGPLGPEGMLLPGFVECLVHSSDTARSCFGNLGIHEIKVKEAAISWATSFVLLLTTTALCS